MAKDRPKTGIKVAVRQGEPILLLKGLIGLSATKVQSLLYSQSGLVFPPGEALAFALPGAAPYKLHVTNRREYDDSPRAPSRLLLESNGHKQTLYEWPQGLLDEHCELIWAGDMDGDGKLDLLMVLSDHYNVLEYTLFLSSKRSSGSLVQRVAAFRIVGC